MGSGFRVVSAREQGFFLLTLPGFSAIFQIKTPLGDRSTVGQRTLTP